MESEVVISVIVPVYNSAQYIRQCVDSLLHQSFYAFELLLIDDGSTDGSAAICDAYEKTDARIKVFHTPNGGPGKARNVGLEKASGRWITFVDSDDWVAGDYIENLYHRIRQVEIQNVCVIQGLTQIVKSAAGWKQVPICPTYEKIYRIRDEKNCFSNGRVDIIKFNYSVGKLFSASLIKEHNIRYDDKVPYLEDLIFCMDYLKYADAVVTIKTTGYYYRCSNPKSLSKKKYPFDTEYRTFQILKRKLEELKECHKLKDSDVKELSNSIYTYYIRVCRSLYYPQHKKVRKERIKILSSLLSKEKGLPGNGIMGRGDKFFLNLLSNRYWKAADCFYNIYIGYRLWLRQIYNIRWKR